MQPIRGLQTPQGPVQIDRNCEPRGSRPAAAEPERGRSRQRRASTDAFEARSAGQLPTAFARNVSLRGLERGAVRFAGDLPERSPESPSSGRRRHPLQDDAATLLSQWASLREQVDQDAQTAAGQGLSPPRGFHDDLEQVQAFVQRCADQVSIARKRARMSLAQLRCISHSAVDLQGQHGLTPEELQFDDTNPESMAAAVRAVLSALDCSGAKGPPGLRRRSRAVPEPVPTRLSFDSDASDTELVDLPLESTSR